MWQVYEALSSIPNAKFTIAAAFGNVHGVYAPGNVKLKPEILHNTQAFVAAKLGLPEGAKPVKFVFHGGSGSSVEDIRCGTARSSPAPILPHTPLLSSSTPPRGHAHLSVSHH